MVVSKGLYKADGIRSSNTESALHRRTTTFRIMNLFNRISFLKHLEEHFSRFFYTHISYCGLTYFISNEQNVTTYRSADMKTNGSDGAWSYLLRKRNLLKISPQGKKS